jgi:hypothetical protein
MAMGNKISGQTVFAVMETKKGEKKNVQNDAQKSPS